MGLRDLVPTWHVVFTRSAGLLGRVNMHCMPYALQ